MVIQFAPLLTKVTLLYIVANSVVLLPVVPSMLCPVAGAMVISPVLVRFKIIILPAPAVTADGNVTVYAVVPEQLTR